MCTLAWERRPGVDGKCKTDEKGPKGDSGEAACHTRSFFLPRHSVKATHTPTPPPPPSFLQTPQVVTLTLQGRRSRSYLCVCTCMRVRCMHLCVITPPLSSSFFFCKCTCEPADTGIISPCVIKHPRSKAPKTRVARSQVPPRLCPANIRLAVQIPQRLFGVGSRLEGAGGEER